MVVILLFLFGFVVALPGIWGVLLLMGKTTILANRDGAEAMAMMLVVGGFSITAVMWAAALFFILQPNKS